MMAERVSVGALKNPAESFLRSERRQAQSQTTASVIVDDDPQTAPPAKWQRHSSG